MRTRHPFTSQRTERLYCARDGMIFGVCKGLSNYRGIDVIWIRLAFIILAFFSAGMAVLLYIGAALVIPAEPAMEPTNDDEDEFYHSFSSDRKLALQRLKHKLDRLEKRTRRMEDNVTDREFDWDERLRSQR